MCTLSVHYYTVFKLFVTSRYLFEMGILQHSVFHFFSPSDCAQKHIVGKMCWTWIVTYSFVNVCSCIDMVVRSERLCLFTSFFLLFLQSFREPTSLPSLPYLIARAHKILLQFMACNQNLMFTLSILNRCTRICICQAYNAIFNVFTTTKQYSPCTFEIFIAFHGYYIGGILSSLFIHLVPACTQTVSIPFGWLSL